jgi:ABC-type multidrug transport system permease subunit
MPAVADGLKGVFQKFFGGTKPVNVDEQIKLMQAETEKLRIIADLDRPAANISQWVADLRASFRYIAAGFILVTTMGFVIYYFNLVYVDPANKALATLLPILDMLLQLAASVFSFMFGDRVYLGLKGAK